MWVQIRQQPFNFQGAGLCFFWFRTDFFFAPNEKQKIYFLARKSRFFSLEFSVTVNVENYINKQYHFSTLERQVIFFFKIRKHTFFFRKKNIAPTLNVKWLLPQQCMYAGLYEIVSLLENSGFGFANEQTDTMMEFYDGPYKAVF